GGGVDLDVLAVKAAAAGQELFGNEGVLDGIAAQDGVARGAQVAVVYGVEGPGVNLAILNLVDCGGLGAGDLVHAVITVDHKGVGGAQKLEHLGDLRGQLAVGYAEQVVLGASGVGEWQQQVRWCAGRPGAGLGDGHGLGDEI